MRCAVAASCVLHPVVPARLERREEDETESTRANEKECSPIIVVVVAFLSSFVESRCYHTNTKGGGVFLFQLSLVFFTNDFLLP